MRNINSPASQKPFFPTSEQTGKFETSPPASNALPHSSAESLAADPDFTPFARKIAHAPSSPLAALRAYDQPVPNEPETDRCPLCNSTLENADSCSHCQWVRGYRHQYGDPRELRNVIAAGLSLIPGAGHCFKGYWLHGSMIFIVGVPITITLAACFTMFFFGWMLIPLFWGAVAADAYFRTDLHLQIAARLPARSPSPPSV